MANPSRTLARQVRWTRILPRLGVTYESTALPAIVTCPACKQGKMRVYHDYLLRAEWLNCPECRFAGDTIQIAAQVWHVKVEEAIERLRRDGILDRNLDNDAVERYVDEVVGLRQRVHQFEQHSIERISRNHTEDLYRLLRRFRIQRMVGEARWKEHGPQIVWAAHHRDVEDLFHPASYAVQQRKNRNERSSERRGPGPGHRRIFKGQGWGDVLVVPHVVGDGITLNDRVGDG